MRNQILIPLSCLIITAGKRINELQDLLNDLINQSLSKEYFEIVLLNDGGGDAVYQVLKPLESLLKIQYLENKVPQRFLWNKPLSPVNRN